MRILLAALAALTLGACALSPQTINVTPVLTVANEHFGRNQTVSVMVTDNRKDAVIGSRGGIYNQSSVIQSANDVAAAVRSEAERGLAAQGYTVTGTEANNLVRMSIEEMSYTVPEGAVATSADIVVALKVVAQRGDTQYETTYRSTVNRRFPVAPTATQNEAWINEVLGETLQRFFNDAKMRAFLAAP